jgi:hypothetical protein
MVISEVTVSPEKTNSESIKICSPKISSLLNENFIPVLYPEEIGVLRPPSFSEIKFRRAMKCGFSISKYTIFYC